MKRTRLSFVAVSVMAAVGCHDFHTPSGSNSEPSPQDTYQVKAIDGYLRGATVWLDLNQNMTLDAGEPSAITGKGGIATLDISDINGSAEDYPLVTKVIKHQSIDEDSGEVVRRSYVMTAPPGVKNITPLTHWVHNKQREDKLSLAEAKSELAMLLEFTEHDDLLSDYVEMKQERLHALARSFAVVLPESEEQLTNSELKQALKSVTRAMNRFYKQQENALGEVDAQAIQLDSIASNKAVLEDEELLVELISFKDTDNDGITDGFDLDDDGDGVQDSDDALPLIASETSDSDGDGIGDEIDAKPHQASNHEQVQIERLLEEFDQKVRSAERLAKRAEQRLGKVEQKILHIETDYQIEQIRTQHQLNQLESELAEAADESVKQSIEHEITQLKALATQLTDEFNLVVAPLVAKRDKANALLLVAKNTKTKVIEQHEKLASSVDELLPEITLEEPDELELELPTSDFAKLKQRIIPDFVAQEQKRVAKSGSTLLEQANLFVAEQNADGSWPNIDYSSTNRTIWPSASHLKKLRTIAAAYAESGLAVYEQSILQALEFWFFADPSAHWWWEDIGKPKFLGSVALQLGEALPESLRQEVVSILPSQPSSTRTGANRTDIALGVLYRGLLTEQAELVDLALSDIENTIQITVEEGIQPDWSFHQHGPQLYTGGYGEVFLNPVIRWAYHVHDLQWKFEQEKVDILVGLLLDGMRWMSRSGQLDYNVSGRGITRPQAELTQSTEPDVIPALTNMDMAAILSPERAEEAMQYKRHVYFGEPSGLDGFKHYWRSDYSVKATDDFMFGIKMNSKRMRPSENGNGENLLGYWLGFGSTFLMQSGREYHNIFPVLDWGKIPGVTAPHYIEAPAYWGNIMQSTSFVGGVSSGKVGITTMDMDMDVTHLERLESNWKLERGKRIPLIEGGGRTKAKKSWFSFDDEIVALGAGIESTHQEPVFTTLNQTLLNGGVTVSEGQQILPQGEHSTLGSQWVHHDNVGYIFLGDAEAKLSNVEQQGSWSKIKRGTSDEIVTKEVFTLAIAHGEKPQNADYEYIIVPSKTVEQTHDYYQSLPIRVIENSADIQAVEHTGLNLVSVVFHQPGNLAISPDYRVSSDQPIALLLDSSGDELKVSLSSPGEAYSVVNLTVERNGTVTNQRVIAPGTAAQRGNSVHFALSQGQDVSLLNDEKAQAIFNGLTEADLNTLEGAEKLRQGVTFAPTEDAFVQGGNSSSSRYGGSGYMQLKNGAGVYDRKILMRFDISQIGQNLVDSAVLKLFVRGVKTEGIDRAIIAQLVDSEEWSEATLTYQNFPKISAVEQSNETIVSDSDKGKWIEVDVANVINAAQLKGDVVIQLADIAENKGANFISFATKEYGDKGPQLILKGVLGERLETESPEDSNFVEPIVEVETPPVAEQPGIVLIDEPQAKAQAEIDLASQIDLFVVQDSRVEGGDNSAKNFGASGYMTVKNGPGKVDRRSILKFDISRLAGAKVSAAKLRVYANVIDLKSLPSASLQAVDISGFNWQEESINWDSLPDYQAAKSSPISAIASSIDKESTNVNRWIEIDITDIVNANSGRKSLDLLLRNPNSSDQIAYYSFATKESGSGAHAAQVAMTNKSTGFVDEQTIATYQTALENWQTHLVGTEQLADDPNAQPIIEKHVSAGKSAFDSLSERANWNKALWDDNVLAGAADGRAVKETFRRLRYMAIAYHMPGELNQNQQLKLALIDALEVMLDTHFTLGMVHKGNWHEWEIGGPAILNDILVLMRKELPESLMRKALDVSRYMLPDPRYQYASEGSRGKQFANTGGNRADTVLINLIRGLLGSREYEVNLALASLPVVLKEVTKGDGFYADGSFLQHVDIPYTGTYGGVLISGVSKVLYTLQGSNLIPEELLTIAGRVHQSYEPLMFKGQMFDMMNGRAIARGWAQASGEGAAITRSLLRLYPALEGESKQRLAAMLKQHLLNNRLESPFAVASDLVYLPIINQLLADESIEARGELNGNFLFSSMDRVVHRKHDYAFTIAAHSYRTGNYEVGSRGENARGWYTGDGMTYLYDADLSQHYNHWPLMDMTRLAGTTTDGRELAHNEGRHSAYKGGRKSNMRWVGGVSNQSFGTFGMDFRNWDESLTAKKSWFMFDDEIVAVGSNIYGENLAQAVTTVDGRKLNSSGDNSVLVDGAQMGNDATVERTLHIEGNVTGSQLGVFFPYQQSVHIERSQVQGDWAVPYGVNIAKMAETQVEGWRLLSTIAHSSENNHYAYVLLPQKSAQETQAYAEGSDVTLLQQNEQIHAVQEQELGLYAANIWVSEEVTTSEIVSQGKLSILTRQQGGDLHVWVSQPSRDEDSIAVQFPQYQGTTIQSDSDSLVKWQDGFFVIDSSKLAGRSYHFVVSH